MEKIEGVTLHEIIRSEDKSTENDTALIIEQLLKVVIYLNNVNIAHCDIRPNNILVNPMTLSLKLIDFGSSNYLFDSLFFNGKVKEPLYAAPEVLIGDFDKKCDVWSIGVIAYHLLSGKLPFVNKSKKKIYRDIVKMKLNYISSDWTNRSKEALDFIAKALNPDADARISAVNALKHPWMEQML